MGYLGAIEGGGTKFVCGVGTEAGEIVDKVSFPTTVPEETLAHLFNYFADKPLDALGVGSFGPINAIPGSDKYGFITTTPKPYWRDTNILGELGKRLNVPFGFDLDVNVAALGEAELGAGRDGRGCLYITVGTGIGGGLVLDGRIVQGFSHAEMGHILVRRHPDDAFAGCCPYHGDCLEGLASGPALEGRWGEKGAALPPDHRAWAIQADYLAQACMNFVLVTMPPRIIIGGGVSQQAHLFPLIRQRFKELMNGYVEHPNLGEGLDAYIVPPDLGGDAGLTGALILARQALSRSR
jgi:fructokinase